MYRNDMPIIADHAWASPEGLHDVIEFVLLTIRQPLWYLKDQRADIAKHGEASRFLFAHKRAGWVYARDNAAALLDGARRLEDPAALIDHFMQVPGLGMVKAAFVAQCLGAETACLDQHNAQRLGIPEGKLKIAPKATPGLRQRKIEEYVALCDSTGGSEYWWDTWCGFVAGRRGSPLGTPEAVSRFHSEAVLMNVPSVNLLAA